MLGLNMERINADLNRLMASLFHQGVLDELFLELQQLQDETSPNFVSEIVSIYFDATEKLIRSLREQLMVEKDLPDYKKMVIHLRQLTGSSSTIGAHRVRNVCVAFRAAAEQNNKNGELVKSHLDFQISAFKKPELLKNTPSVTVARCIKALEALEYEYGYLKSKLQELFQIEQRRILAAATTTRYPAQEQHPNNP